MVAAILRAAKSNNEIQLSGLLESGAARDPDAAVSAAANSVEHGIPAREECV
ncbi:hypothetical protein [Nocardia sp. alder85J]|uniref:hypothetical protein n=1 Tax=Nocardia sp. alder85J TaxID=2862949 RepID=UPI001CD4E532|nr:hypothetical protein [Nocardia sp. alder85J]MCX4097557.1 hypothetical protein [Nocardia sp. alder85J]